MKFYQEKLSNGLTLIGEYRETAVDTALGFFVQTGARDENKEVSGVSHFLEHMMFKGTAKRSALDITYEMGAIGAQANAYTSEENTVYYMAVLPEYFERAFELLSDMLRPALSEEEFSVEKNVILEEIALYQDRPSYLLFEAALREYFGKHPAGSSVLGSIESVSGLTREQMKNYFDARYSPNNMVLAVSGNFDWEQVKQLAEQYCAHWKSLEAPRLYEAHEPEVKNIELTKENLNRSLVCLVGRGPSAVDEMRYSSDILACILGDSSGSKAYWQLIDKGLADSASIGTDAMDGTGIIYAFGASDPINLDTVSEILRNIMSKASEFTEKDLDRAKTKVRTRLVLQGESSMRRLMAIGTDWLYRGDYSPLEQEQLKYKAVTKDSIAALLNEYSFAPITQVTLVPK